ncbi:TPA: mannose-1-phosphate guanylyltransferase/mannose-6-phosphate isomerase [Escherichia coli]|nr:mannose-1-phosphate guanylyltransferase/mannose-6-phosphate isomerase [Escherichia coli]
MKIVPVVLAGGSGTRLWPLSRTMYPKQFLKIFGHMTMLQTTLSRMNSFHDATDAIVICNETHRFVVAEQLNQIDKKSTIILEPCGRSTAPAVALAAMHIVETINADQDVLLLVLPADHIIKDLDTFHQAVKVASSFACGGKLVTFGIPPLTPETGYGYIQRGNSIGTVEGSECFEVSKFVEKPDVNTATQFLNDSNYYWNSGMFMFSARTYLEELQKYCPDIVSVCQKSYDNSVCDLDFIRIDEKQFSNCLDLSIDYALMEHTNEAIVVPMDGDWSDVGSWASLWDITNKDNNGNVLWGDILTRDSSNNYIYGESGLITTLGVEDLVIVQTKDALLVANRKSVQDIKQLVEQLKLRDRSEYYIHRETYRPWGKCDTIDKGKRYQVKRIEVKPGEGISLQLHHHRSEHWVVVSGTAKITINGVEKIISENESIYIPLGAKHCLENPGKITLELIEIRSGSYLAEDDIIRFFDKYGRI